MSIEAEELARRINALDGSAEKKKNTDLKAYETGLREYHLIKTHIKFILPKGLKLIPNYLNDNGKKNYDRFFKKPIEEEINKSERKK